jgi:O-antigen/teichoic acid export membrane protein
MNLKNIFSKTKFLDYGITFGSEFFILLISVILFKVINIKYGDTGFAEFAIGKRLFGFIIPFMFLGMGVSLPKFLPVSNDSDKISIYYTSVIMVTVLSVALGLVTLIFPNEFSRLIFGDTSHVSLLLWLLAYAYVLLLHACVYNYFRGKMNFVFSSVLQLINLGILPILVYLFSPDLNWYFINLCVLTFVFILSISIWKVPFISVESIRFKMFSTKLFNYGIQRMPGDVILGLFFAVPSFYLANKYSLIQAGNVAFCLSLFNIIIAVMSPVNIILLPKASQIINEKDFVLLKSIGLKLLKLSLVIGISALIGVFILGDFVLNLFSIKDVEVTKDYLVITFSGVIGYSVFSVIRSVLDAYYERARVSSIIIVTFVLFLLSLFVFELMSLNSEYPILISFSVCMNLLGVFCAYFLLKINRKHT